MEDKLARQVRRLEDAWFTIPALPEPRPMADKGTLFWVRWEGVVVRGASWGRGPCVYLVHGWGGETASFGAFVGPLVESGFRVVAFDWPSHGGSGDGLLGRGRSSALEMAGAFRTVASRFDESPAGIVAHSLGATAALLPVQEGRISPERLVLLAPVVDLPGQLRKLQVEQRFSDAVHDGLAERIAHRVGAALGEFSTEALLSGDRLPETLVYHDPEDPVAPFDALAEHAGSEPRIRVEQAPGRGHHRVLFDPGVIRGSVDFLRGDLGRSSTRGPAASARTAGARNGPSAQIA